MLVCTLGGFHVDIWPLGLVGDIIRPLGSAKKPGVVCKKYQISRSISRRTLARIRLYPRYSNTTRSRFRSPIRVNLTLDMVVHHDRGPSTSTRLAGACVVASLRTVTAFQRPPRGGLRRLGRECAQKPGTLNSRVSKGATTRLQPCREPARLQPRCLLYTSPSPRDKRQSRMPSSA